MHESDETYGEVLRAIHAGNQRIGQVGARVADMARQMVMMRQYASWSPGRFEQMLGECGGDVHRLGALIDGVSDSELESLIREANELEARAREMNVAGIDARRSGEYFESQADEVETRAGQEDESGQVLSEELAEDYRVDSRRALEQSSLATASSTAAYGSSEHKREIAASLQAAGASKAEGEGIAQSHASFGKPIAGRAGQSGKKSSHDQVSKARLRQAQRHSSVVMSK